MNLSTLVTHERFLASLTLRNCENACCQSSHGQCFPLKFIWYWDFTRMNLRTLVLFIKKKYSFNRCNSAGSFCTNRRTSTKYWHVRPILAIKTSVTMVVMWNLFSSACESFGLRRLKKDARNMKITHRLSFVTYPQSFCFGEVFRIICMIYQDDIVWTA